MITDREAVTHRRLTAALDASGVGTWEWMIDEDRVVCCETTAKLFGLSPREAAEGSPLSRYMRAMHPEDRQRFGRGVETIRQEGGLYVAEYRTVPAPGHIRWVLARGRFEPGANGQVPRARGIVVDVTESRSNGSIEGDPFVVSTSEEGTTLDRLSDAALQMRRLTDTMDRSDAARLRPLLELLLLELGRQQAGALEEVDRGAARRGIH